MAAHNETPLTSQMTLKAGFFSNSQKSWDLSLALKSRKEYAEVVHLL